MSMKLQERLRELLAKATPGPWRVADWSLDDGDNLTTIESNGRPEVLGPGQSSIWPGGIVKERIASTEEGSFDRETNLANAELIALAPTMAAQLDLYEAALRQAALDLHEAAGRFAIHSKLDMPSCAEATRNAARRADEALGATL